MLFTGINIWVTKVKTFLGIDGSAEVMGILLVIWNLDTLWNFSLHYTDISNGGWGGLQLRPLSWDIKLTSHMYL